MFFSRSFQREIERGNDDRLGMSYEARNKANISKIDWTSAERPQNKPTRSPKITQKWKMGNC